MFVDPKITFGEGVTPTPTDIRYARVALESQLAQDQRYGRGVSQVRHHLPTGSVCVATHEYGLTYLHITASPEAGRKKTVKARSSTSSTPTKYVIASVVGSQTDAGALVVPATLQFWRSVDGIFWSQFSPSSQLAQLLQTPRNYPITTYPVHFVQIEPRVVFGVWADSSSPSGWSWGMSAFDMLSFGEGTHLPMPDGFFPNGLFIQQVEYGGESCVIFNVNAGELDQGPLTYRYICWLDLSNNEWVARQSIGEMINNSLYNTYPFPKPMSASGGPIEPLSYLTWVTPIPPPPGAKYAQAAISLTYHGYSELVFDGPAGDYSRANVWWFGSNPPSPLPTGWWSVLPPVGLTAAALVDPNTGTTGVLESGTGFLPNYIPTYPRHTFAGDPSGNCIVAESLSAGSSIDLWVFSSGALQSTTSVAPPAYPSGGVAPALWAAPIWTPVGLGITWQNTLGTASAPSFTLLPPAQAAAYIQRPTADGSAFYPFLTMGGLRDFVYGGTILSSEQTTELRVGRPPLTLDIFNPKSVYYEIPQPLFSFLYGFCSDITAQSLYSINPLTHLMVGPDPVDLIF